MTNTAASDFLAGLFGPGTEAAVFVCSLPNADARGREPGERYVATRDLDEVDGFVAKYDRADRGLFFCVATLVEGAVPERPGGSPRCKANVAEIIGLHADVDLKDVGLDLEEIVERVRALPLAPSILVASGRGLHAYWLLHEGLPADEATVARVEAALRALADVVGGDRQVAEVARLMRLPGSHHTKDGGWTEVRVLEGGDHERRYELADVEEMLGYCAPVIERVARPGAERARDPWAEQAARHAYHVPVDVDARLAAMSHRGVGDAAIHATQLAVTASLLTRGEDVEDVVERVLAATREAAGADGKGWDWRAEERAIRRMCDDWMRKRGESLRDDSGSKVEVSQADRGESLAVGGETIRAAVGGGSVVDLEARRRAKDKPKVARTPPKGEGAAAAAVVIADGAIEAVRAEGGDLLLAEGDLWIYEDGVWRTAAGGDEQWLRTLIQTGCDRIGRPGDVRAANAAWKRLTEHPDLHRRRVDWDSGRIVATGSGLLDLTTRAASPYRPDAYCRAKIGTPYVADARCPTWLAFLDSAFANRAPADRRAVIAALQEAFGSFVAVRLLAREQRKAVFLLGPSRSGKSQVSAVARGLIGAPIASPSVVDIAERFGLEPLHGARAWIRDDAVSEQDRLEPARFKAIVTGEAVSVNRKNRDQVDVSFAIPILLTANAMPRARDASDAIYNRSLVLEMTHVIDEDATGGAHKALGLPEGCALGEEIVRREGAGILNWALDGLDRLRTRGRFDPPASMREAVRRFRDDNNPVAAWLAVAVEADPRGRVARRDLRCSFNGWQREEMGDDARAWGGRQFFPALRTLAPWADLDGHQEHDGERFATGIRVTREGLRYWSDHNLDVMRNGAKGYAVVTDKVNRPHGPEPSG